MSKIANNILELAAGNLAELMEGGFSEGFIPAALNKVREHFTGNDSLRRYYNQAVKRSILSLEIALKGPRAYYPSREKEFYKKHFLRFEKKIFLPFSEQLMQKGVVPSEDHFRTHCIGDCEKIKKVAASSLGLAAAQTDIQKILGQTALEADLSQKMLVQLQKKAGCDFLIRLLQCENVLLSGIVFHFHCFIQSDQKLSNYVNYLEMAEIKKNLVALHKQRQTNPQDKKLVMRLKRLEKLTQMLSSYQNNMGAIGKKLDGIYAKTVQTYEVLQRIETQMKTSFNGLEEKLDNIYAMLNKQETKEVETQTSLKAPQNKLVESSWEEIIEKPQKIPAPPRENVAAAQKATNLPHKHRRNVVPASIFNASEEKKCDSPTVSFSEQEPLEQEETDVKEELDSCLKLYTTFLQDSEKDNEVLEPQKTSKEHKKDKRVRGDQISQIFMDQ